jgi:hypothetical protein
MKSKTSDTYLVRRLLGTRGAESVIRRHRWYNEQHRWIELVGALLSAKLHIPNSTLRLMLQQLRTLDLLSIPRLLQTSPIFVDASSEEVVLETLATLRDRGLSEADAMDAAKVIHEAAHCLGDKYNGKVQLALRKAGEELLNAMRKEIKLESLSEEELRVALTIWLQNVLNLPISLSLPSIQRFCKTHGISAMRLIEGADHIDLNMAALDDLVEHWDLKQRRSSQESKV